MPFPEALGLVHTASGTPPSSPKPEVAMTHARVQFPALRLDLVNAKLHDLCRKLDQSEIGPYKPQSWYEAEVRRSQTFQQGLEVQQQKYMSMSEEHDRDMAILQRDLELAESPIVTQKEMIDYQGQQQQPESHLVPGSPLLSCYNGQNQSYQSYQPYQPPHHPESVIDPASLRQLSSNDYNITTPIDSPYDTQLAMPTPVGGFDRQTSNLSIPSMLHPVPAERDVPAAADIGTGAKRGPEDEDEEAKSTKKRKLKLRPW